MKGRLISIDPQADPRWDDFVVRHPLARLPHSSPWLGIVQRSYGYQPAHLAYETDGTIEGLLPLLMISSKLTGRRLVSFPLSHPTGPLGTSQEIVNALVAGAISCASAL